MADTTIDVSTYQTEELAGHIADVLDVPGRVWLFVRVFVLVMGGTALVAVGAAQAVALPWWGYLILIPYFALAGSVVGAVTGLLLIVRAEVQRGEMLLGVLVDTSEQVVRDIDAMATGSAPIPSAASILEGVWSQLFVPAVTAGLTSRLGALAGYVGGLVLRRTVGAGVAFMASVLRAEGVDDADVVAGFEEAVRTAHPELSANAGHVLGALEFSRSVTGAAAGAIRAVAVPLWVALGVAFAMLALPPALLLYLAA